LYRYYDATTLGEVANVLGFRARSWLESCYQQGLRQGQRPGIRLAHPTCNQVGYLGAALDSLIAQTDPDWEAVVVNDGSSDATAEVLADYCSRDRRLRAINKENGGLGSVLNAGLKQARRSWVCWVIYDDLFEHDKH
jgi:cellulose synthase/poly-beta-1,6-N-acetylglucosamine synthase-like glycosyltransferase